jgi:DNA-binding LytR/AlgR family response regulator
MRQETKKGAQLARTIHGEAAMNCLKINPVGSASRLADAGCGLSDLSLDKTGQTIAVDTRARGKQRGISGTLSQRQAGEHSPSLRVAIKVRGKILFIDLEDVEAVRAQGKCVLLQRNDNAYLLRDSISAVAEKLQTCGFVRIHRSVLVNALFVQEIRPLSTGEYCLRVAGGREYTVTRTYKKNLRLLAESWIGTSASMSS